MAYQRFHRNFERPPWRDQKTLRIRVEASRGKSAFILVDVSLTYTPPPLHRSKQSLYFIVGLPATARLATRDGNSSERREDAHEALHVAQRQQKQPKHNSCVDADGRKQRSADRSLGRSRIRVG
jgi:hypothetical protein